MKQKVHSTLLIGHDLLILGLAAQLRARGARVVVRAELRRDLEAAIGGAVPSAIIVDLLVARRDDFALLRRLRDYTPLARVPIIVLSAGTIGVERATLESRLRSLGARPLLAPHDLDDVLEEVERSLPLLV